MLVAMLLCMFGIAYCSVDVPCRKGLQWLAGICCDACDCGIASNNTISKPLIASFLDTCSGSYLSGKVLKDGNGNVEALKLLISLKATLAMRCPDFVCGVTSNSVKSQPLLEEASTDDIFSPFLGTSFGSCWSGKALKENDVAKQWPHSAATPDGSDELSKRLSTVFGDVEISNELTK
ncbi:hypothetical protein FXO38_25567 [Capsicum annuum]|nr:hypothetical protein FXO38_25567 [Capsicum annuum]KAF3670963.1 hypothetical protein FXO37_08290 [Capsicum annuum]